MRVRDLGHLGLTDLPAAELDRRLAEIAGALRRRGSGAELEPLPTGSLALDRATGLGGLPRGRLVALTGAARGSRELIAAAVAEAQRRGGLVALVDHLGWLDRDLTRRLQVDNRELLVTRPPDALQALSIAESLVQQGAADLLILPVPTGRKGEKSAAVVSALRSLASSVKESSTCVLLIDVTPATAAPEATLIVRDTVRRISELNLATRSAARTAAGRRFGIEVVGASAPNRVGSSERASIEIKHKGGISRVGDLLDTATAEALVERRGRDYRYGGVLLGRSREHSKRTLRDRPEVALEIESTLERSLLKTRRRARESVGKAKSAAASNVEGERVDGTATAAGELVGKPSETAQRFVHTWFVGDDPVLPLTVGRATPFFLRIGRRGRDAQAGVAPFAEPDWGNKSELRLLISLYGRELRIEPRQQTLWLPREGDSESLRFTVTALAAGTCRMRIVISLAHELEVLQRLRLEIDAKTAPTPVAAEAG